MRAAAALAALLCALPLHAHDLLSAAAAERYLQQAQRWRTAAASDAPAQRAEAHYRIGVMLDEIRGRLDGELATHGKVQGLAARYLLEELERLGLPPARAQTHFEQAFALAPRAAFAADAGYRLLRGRFDSSFEQDPLDWKVDRDALAAQIALAEGLLERFPAHARREEIEFITAILYTRAARLPEDRLSTLYATKARAAAEAFAARYPESLRATSMPVLREALPQN